MAKKPQTPAASPGPVVPANPAPTNHIGSIHIPAGRTLADLPKSGPKPIPFAGPKPLNTRLTLKQMITENDTKEYLIPFLKDLGVKRKKGPWRAYLEFYIANHSGDVDSMKEDVKNYCEKMVKELNDEYFEEKQL